MGRMRLQTQAYSSDRPTRISKEFTNFLLKNFRLFYVRKKNYIFFYWTEQLTNFCANFSLFSVDLIYKKNWISREGFFCLSGDRPVWNSQSQAHRSLNTPLNDMIKLADLENPQFGTTV